MVLSERLGRHPIASDSLLFQEVPFDDRSEFPKDVSAMTQKKGVAQPLPVQEGDARRYLDALYRISGFITAVSSLPNLLELIMEESKALMHAEGSSLLLYDADQGDLYFEVALGEAGETVKRIRLELGEGIAGVCAKERKPIIVNDAASDPRHSKKADQESKFTTRNLLAVPMIARGEKLIGVLEVINTLDRETFSEEDAKTLEIFADQAALAIDNSRLIAENVKNERLAAIGIAVAGISHYIKNILAGMAGSKSLIQLGLAQGDVELIKECWPIFERSQDKIGGLVKDMLTFSKERVPDFQPGDLNSLGAEVVHECASLASSKNVAVEMEPDPSIPPTLFDPIQMHDCLLNLVTNAIDASANVSGARIVVRTRSVKEGEMLAVAVEDNGCGIPSDDIPRLFEPFFSTKGSKGTGLGLAVVRKIVNEHGGEVGVDSTPGAGTTFEIRLPPRSIDDWGSAQ